MKPRVCCQLLSLLWLILPEQIRPSAGSAAPQHTHQLVRPGSSVIGYSKSLRFNIYTFSLASPDSGAVRDVTIKAYRGELLLTNFSTRVDGAVVGAEVADLDQNRYPELYIYTASDGSGSFGRVYAWQFLPERKADVQLTNWRITPADGYMGHDSLWVERDVLCRRYPVYRPGDANASPTGGAKTKRYQLRPSGQGFTLTVDR